MPIAESFNRFRRPKVTSPNEIGVAPDISPLIEPAQGEEKERLLTECKEYLQNPSRITASDFLEFTQNMISLIGGVRTRVNNMSISCFSDIFEDKETQASMVFNTTRTDDANITTAKITSRHPDTNILETLAIVSFPLNSGNYVECQWTMTSIDTPLTPSLPKSYITGKEEKRLPIIGTRDLNSIEAKGFAQRVFEVYQRQGQQAQSPTSQN